MGPILSGSDSEKKAAEEKVAEEKSRDEKLAEEKPLPWEDAGYIRWEKAMFAMLLRLKKRASVKSNPSSPT